MGLKDVIVDLFQLDKDWTTRIVMGMLVLGIIWGLLGVIDSLMVRLVEASWGLSAVLPLTPQEYFAGITLHAERDLFGFAQQVIYAIFIYFTIKLLNIEPRAKWMLNLGFIAVNLSMMFMEGPILIVPAAGFDNYFSATIWYYISPLGIPGYSQYVVSPLFFWGWILLDAFTYIGGFWIVYHYYLASKNMKEKLPVPLVYFLMVTLMFMIGYSGVTAADVWDVLAFYHIVGLDPIANQIAFWIFGHAVVYMAWVPAVGALYLLIPMLANRPLYSERMGRISALLYLIFSNNVPIHHLYMVNLPIELKFLQEVLTYSVVIPSMMTFFNLWATAKGANVNWNIITAWTVTSFAGAIAAGVTGISNATISFDAIVHNTDWIVGHFHAMILFSIVPAAWAVLYIMITMMSGRMWFSKVMAWVHYIGYMIGTTLLIVGFELVGFYGIVRRAEVYPRVPGLIDAEVIATVGAIIADLATLVWFLNLVLTLVKGRLVRLEGLSLPQVAGAIAMSLEWPSSVSFTPILQFIKAHNASKKGLGSMIALAVVGAILIIISAFILAFAGDAYTTQTWIWITILTIGIVFSAIGSLKGMKSI
ncbi:cbb3-type cytochrome c oxidase subunit I [Saccharolobus shibatae]|uniref:Cytochrome c oxidase polypeptide I n=2 Tax=Saccharolobus shibatae TaxID=2286 RepID=A0A8F5BSG3_9CREN|nr:cbb3-type cytochrome c oxidase subunit I [Saccharolobus shibatae]QXJ27340.1 Cytochrome c oxidase polypeptide I [Saccharolobus shibatae B12]QXJ30648.1 Cytochrome c oxidase polypeptide I [Saccharolobus shibatae]QXJ33676.1 Cytochrome c oxidase polypeptide I [Saccharolobus shibatae]